jgi:hypothetical protein
MDLKKIEKYIRELQHDEINFKREEINSYQEDNIIRKVSLKHALRSLLLIALSGYDYLQLRFLFIFNSKAIKNKRIVFTANNFCTEKNGVLEDRIVKPLFTDNIIFINQSKEIRLSRVNGQKVYNLGGLVKLISHIMFKSDSRLMRIFRAYRVVNDSFIKYLKGSELYMLWFYDINSLSLIFSKYRNRVKLIEVQHGSIINYPPYKKPAPVCIADVFYVKNQLTIDYLKTHLCADYPAEYRIIPYPQYQREHIPGLHLFYASTVEFNGLHPVFMDFLKRNNIRDLHVIIRLHPREREKESIFAEQLDELNIKYEFDHSKNWLEGLKISNMIVISPWSSTLEDAYDNGFVAITIDKVGKERFRHLIDNLRFYYSDDLTSTLKCIDPEKILN